MFQNNNLYHIFSRQTLSWRAMSRLKSVNQYYFKKIAHHLKCDKHLHKTGIVASTNQ